MEIPILIQVRYTSSRLPGKALLPLGSDTILGACINRCLRSKLGNQVIVCTSNQSSDDCIEEFCLKRGVKTYRGSLNDVLKRFTDYCNSSEAKAFVRICGDSPLIDPELIDRAISIYKDLHYLNKNVDIVTNVHPRSYPRGQSVEVINSKTLIKINQSTLSKEFREHLTSYFYQHYVDFNIFNFKNKNDLSKINLSIDTKEDHKLIQNLIELVGYSKIELLNWMDITSHIIKLLDSKDNTLN